MSIILLTSYGSYGMEEKPLSLEQLIFKAHLYEENNDNLEQLKKDMESDNPEITIKTTFCKSIFKDSSNQLQPSQQLLFNAALRHFDKTQEKNLYQLATKGLVVELLPERVQRTKSPYLTQLTPGIFCSVLPLIEGNNAYIFQAKFKKDEMRHLMP